MQEYNISSWCGAMFAIFDLLRTATKVEKVQSCYFAFLISSWSINLREGPSIVSLQFFCCAAVEAKWKKFWREKSSGRLNSQSLIPLKPWMTVFFLKKLPRCRCSLDSYLVLALKICIWSSDHSFSWAAFKLVLAASLTDIQNAQCKQTNSNFKRKLQ